MKPILQKAIHEGKHDSFRVPSEWVIVKVDPAAITNCSDPAKQIVS